jgi:NADH-ubiquinone oxidoreductase chain 5
MMIVLSVGLYELAYFHLIRHALFKSLLFLCAGYFIHAGLNCQDIRLVGKRYLSFPRTNIYFVGCSLSLCGFPFLAGFYSKDLILERYFFNQINLCVYLFIVIGTMFTISYSVRLYYYLYIKNFKRVTLGLSEDSGVGRILMGGPIIVLFIFSILVGSWFT